MPLAKDGIHSNVEAGFVFCPNQATGAYGKGAWCRMDIFLRILRFFPVIIPCTLCKLRNLWILCNLRIVPILMKVAGDSDILGIIAQKLSGRAVF